jgi:hypothetical protein
MLTGELDRDTIETRKDTIMILIALVAGGLIAGPLWVALAL